MICAWTGERELALGQLEALTKTPGSYTYGNLRLNPMWDPLRGDPRFEKIVASLAPKKRHAPNRIQAESQSDPRRTRFFNNVSRRGRIV